MNHKKLVTGLCFLSLCAFAGDDTTLEQLLGVTVNDQGITFQVASNGCTERGDFSFNVVEVLESLSPMLPALEHHHYISITRNNPDSCEALIPYGTLIFMSFQELGIAFGKFHIKNPIGGDKFLAAP